ncbi:hypothetical protein EJ05DRAFT_70936 [Pseudovirgaria hyperparasitica]|uniref:Rhodanese domain-containing protein n=1 Tax=Pseudovirgaria hyperparasitica TaxID=470096 RepID=A0A6A6W251_9PEZI|nr:uncharacterized protein EJ05DRAFT_70936 [Pseudovirgaria hyperparasitica]KAF2756635.1 hypothetical protein EJ05DRAFT_70936 [Pseudovirgaria hyperparasitica]
MPTTTTTTSPSPWSQFPTVQHPAPFITAEQTLTTLQSSSTSSTNTTPSPPLPLLLIDVRRNDYLGGAIKGSLNLPAETFHANRAELYELCRRAGVAEVVFYCVQGVDEGV